MIAVDTPALTATAPRSWRGEVRALLRLSLPLVGANLLQMAVYSSDVIFVARLGTDALAAATLGVYLYAMLLFALVGLVSAAAPLIAAELGRRKHAVREVRRSVRMGLWLSVLASLPLIVVLLNGATLLQWMGQDPLASARAGQYIDVLVISMIPAVAGNVLRITVAALGRPNWAMAVTALGLLVNIVGNWLLVFGNLGFPRLELVGAAIASVITVFVMLGAYMLILSTDRRLRRYRLLGNWWRPEWSRLIEMVRLGVPIAVTMVFEGSVFSAAAFLMGLIGVTDVAAHAVAMQIAAITFQVPFGIAQAATIRVGMGYGARDPEWIALAGKTALMLGSGFMGLAALALLIWPRLFVHAYLGFDARDLGTVALAVSFLKIAAIFQIFDGIQAVAAGVLRGIQDTRIPMIIAGLSYWIAGFGSAILFGFHLGFDGMGIWMGLATGLVFAAALLGLRWALRERLGLIPAPTIG